MSAILQTKKLFLKNRKILHDFFVLIIKNNLKHLLKRHFHTKIMQNLTNNIMFAESTKSLIHIYLLKIFLASADMQVVFHTCLNISVYFCIKQYIFLLKKVSKISLQIIEQVLSQRNNN